MHPWIMRRISQLVVVLSIVYTIAIVIWQALRLCVGDRWWWLAAANVLSLYLFLPLVFLLPLALSGVRKLDRGRRWIVIAVTAMPSVVFLMLYGDLFLPRISFGNDDGAKAFKVMTLNVLFTSDDVVAIEDLVKAELPDLICLQELNPRLARDLVARWAREYPYYALLPEESPTGLGVFSRHPLQDGGEIPDPAWKHGAQAVAVDFAEESVLVLNVHAVSPTWPSLSPGWPLAFERGFQLRENQVHLWLDRILQHEGPTVVAGDLNSTDQNVTYRLLAVQLSDAHRQAGWGLGHTAPASPRGLDGIASPSRLFRIDFVWYSDHWRAQETHVGEWDGRSDHLPVFANLLLQPKRRW
jgi:endonuclease/exonuclease/phosphatase (EEP) superfamily protein YafD